MVETSGSCANSISFGKSHYYQRNDINHNNVMPKDKQQYSVVNKIKEDYKKRSIYQEEEIARKIEAKSPESRTKDESLFLFGYKTKVAAEKLYKKLGDVNPVCHYDKMA